MRDGTPPVPTSDSPENGGWTLKMSRFDTEASFGISGALDRTKRIRQAGADILSTFELEKARGPDARAGGHGHGHREAKPLLSPKSSERFMPVA